MPDRNNRTTHIRAVIRLKLQMEQDVKRLIECSEDAEAWRRHFLNTNDRLPQNAAIFTEETPFEVALEASGSEEEKALVASLRERRYALEGVMRRRFKPEAPPSTPSPGYGYAMLAVVVFVVAAIASVYFPPAIYLGYIGVVALLGYEIYRHDVVGWFQQWFTEEVEHKPDVTLASHGVDRRTYQFHENIVRHELDACRVVRENRAFFEEMQRHPEDNSKEAQDFCEVYHAKGMAEALHIYYTAQEACLDEVAKEDKAAAKAFRACNFDVALRNPKLHEFVLAHQKDAVLSVWRSECAAPEINPRTRDRERVFTDARARHGFMAAEAASDSTETSDAESTASGEPKSPRS